MGERIMAAWLSGLTALLVAGIAWLVRSAVQADRELQSMRERVAWSSDLHAVSARVGQLEERVPSSRELVEQERGYVAEIAGMKAEIKRLSELVERLLRHQEEAERNGHRG
jgi:ElaB/YqjD/DUF883 family membrane-anchored ribosome-binding protein